MKRFSLGWAYLLLIFSLAVNAWAQEQTSLPDQEAQATSTDLPATAEPQEATTPAADSNAAKPKPKAPEFKPFLFQNNYSYLDDPDNEYHYLGDAFKQQHWGDDITYSLGGEERLRYQHENMFTRRDDFLLTRTRLFADIHFDDWFRVYTEAIDADEIGNRHPFRTNEVNRFDALNLFADGRLLAEDNGDLWLRGGRQQMAYGTDRVIGARDWPNTMITYDGAKLFWQSKDWEANVFWFRPVTLAQHTNPDQTFDSADPNRELMGVYTIYHGIEKQVIEPYYIRYDNYGAGPFQYNTLGVRWQGEQGPLLWEIEGAYQFGEAKAQAQSAGFFAVGAGHKFADIPCEPTFWVYYNWFSGDNNPTDHVNNTYNQIFSSTPTFLGYMTLFGNSNLQDLNLRYSMKLAPQVTLAEGLHIFSLASARDALYDIQGNALRQDPTGAAGNDVGQELDTTVRWDIDPRTSLLTGYCHFSPGQFMAKTTGGSGGQQDFVFTQFAMKF